MIYLHLYNTIFYIIRVYGLLLCFLYVLCEFALLTFVERACKRAEAELELI